MHNFGVPSVRLLLIDQIARVGRTFSYADGTPKGLIVGKKATFIIATGGIYDAQTRAGHTVGGDWNVQRDTNRYGRRVHGVRE